MKDGFIKVAAATPKIRVADCEYNASEIIRLCREADALGVKILVFPELCVTGYTCGDLFLQDTLIDAAAKALTRIAKETAELDMLIALGCPVRDQWSGKLYNCAALLNRGQLRGLRPKMALPNYGEFYEQRWFTAGGQGWNGDVKIGGQRFDARIDTDGYFSCDALPDLAVGVEICEDLWAPDPPSTALARAGATVILNLSASNELVGKAAYRRELVKNQSARLHCAYIYADAGEGESSTDLVFAGHNMIAENGTILAESRFKTGLTVSEIDIARLAFERRRNTTFQTSDRRWWQPGFRFNISPTMLEQEETALTRPVVRNPFVPSEKDQREERCREIFAIQTQGLKKRLEHTGSQKLVVGVSGGLDSTLAMLVSAMAARELGLPREALVAVTMPCFGTTQRTKSNAMLLAERLGAQLRVVDITASVRQHFADIGHDESDRSVTYENAQARERTQVLMDIANSINGLVVGTGDLSELALGWATYNGDHMSMYGVNAGVPKTLVRYVVGWYADTCGDAALSGVLNDILATPVSPELLPAENGEISQKTEDLVGPYELHDFFLYYFVRWGMGPAKIFRLAKYAFAGAYDDAAILKWLRTFVRRFFAQQFKRSCLPDGPKVGSVALSPRGDWRMPSDAAARAWLQELEEIHV